MTCTELWLTYHQVSRADRPSTAQLIALDAQGHKLADLEDVLEHVFQQGYVDAKLRPMAWWEHPDGTRVKGSQAVEQLLEQGVGHCESSAMRLIIADVMPAIWFRYEYVHNPSAPVVTQRVKLDAPHANIVTSKLAHLTNHVFAQGYLLPKHRSIVYWRGMCGKKIDEHTDIQDVLSWGEGVSEEKPIRLVIDATYSRVC